MTQFTVPFVLPEDVVLTPVRELAAETRARLGALDDDVAVTRPRSRSPSSVVDADFAALLQRFRTSRTIVDAVVEFSREREADPRDTLAGAYPVLRRLIRSGLLLPAEDPAAKAISGSYEVGDCVGEFRIHRRISLLHDVELYLARSPDGALRLLKLARPAGGDAIRRSIDREARILERLDGACSPRLIASSEHDGVPFLAIEWCAGVSPTTVAVEFRETGQRPRLVTLCRGVVRAYETLHAQGVIHGDVHDRNVLVDRGGRVIIVDFGLSRALDVKRGPHRGGVWLYHDPELAAAQLGEAPSAPADAKTDQYAVGALLYMMVTGQSYLDFSIRREAALRQIITDPPLSFESRGVPAWPELEPVVGRMLAKMPAARYESMTAVVASLDAATQELPQTTVTVPGVSSFERNVFDRVGVDSGSYRKGLAEPPLCGVNNGAAGVAHAWYRLSLLRDDSVALSNAVAWGLRGAGWMTSDGAFYTPDHLISPKTVGRVALFHCAPGLHCVRTLVALAGGEFPEADRCAAAFARSARSRSDNPDLTLGRAGLLLGCTMIDEASPHSMPVIQKLGTRLASRIVEHVTASPGLERSSAIRTMGIAHGWAGVLYASLRWSLARDERISTAVADRVAELSDVAQPIGRGLSWPMEVGQTRPDPIPTWCNGDAGFVFFWLFAAHALQEPRYVKLAEAAAWNAWDGSKDTITHLCCGLAGRAYALVALYRHTDDAIWLTRAKQLAARAATLSDPDASDAHRLYRGALGVALLVAELEVPERARMPFFEPEGWHWDRKRRRPRIVAS